MYRVDLTIKGTETVTLTYATAATAIEAAATVARALADYEPKFTPLGGTFTTELVSINVVTITEG